LKPQQACSNQDINIPIAALLRSTGTENYFSPNPLSKKISSTMNKIHLSSMKPLLAAGVLVSVSSASHAAITMTSTFSDILGLPDLAGATIICSIEYPDTGNYVDGGGFAAVVANSVSIEISGASNGTLNGIYANAGGAPGMAFPTNPTVDLAVNNLAGQVPIAFALPGGTLGLQLWLNSTSTQPSIGDAIDIADFESSPPSSVALSTVIYDGNTANSSTATTTSSTIPEPSSFALLALGLMCLSKRRR